MKSMAVRVSPANLYGIRDRQKSYIVDSAGIITIARGTDDAT